MPADVNYDESHVPAYTLPDPLVDAAGLAVADAQTWRTRRRGQILRLFADHVYGRLPGPLAGTRHELVEESRDALGGTAVRRQLRLTFGAGASAPGMDLLLYLPRAARGRVPVFLGLNFYGNHTICADPAIRLTSSWVRDDAKHATQGHRATEASRGTAASRWAVARLLDRGYGLATAYCGDLDPDFDDGYANGIHPLFYRAGQTRPDPHEWGAIGAWAWGLSRALDALRADADIDGERVAAMGHSRLGKTALWAGACDERFALVIANNSGCGGAALARRRFGETVARINAAFPHWFCDDHRRYDDREDELPVDQHELIALAAPRPVYVASAEQDRWADPKGEFLAAYCAGPVFELFGLQGLAGPDMPPVGQARLDGCVGYHVRAGAHDVTAFDWERWMDFADRHWERA